MLKPIVKVIEVPTGAVRAYQLFAMDMGRWWPLDRRSISFHTDGVAAKRLETDPVAGGAIVEIAADDERHVWGVFVDCDPPNSLTIDFHMGHPQEQATHLIVSFMEMDESHTLVKLVHSGWENYGSQADMMRDGYETGWDEIFTGAYARACARLQPV